MPHIPGGPTKGHEQDQQTGPGKKQGGGDGGKGEKPARTEEMKENNLVWRWNKERGAWEQVAQYPDGDPGTGSGSGGYGGYGGGGGGGGGGGANPLVSAGSSVYFQLWGQAAPPGYIEGLVGQGMNIFEIEMHERKKPAFRLTDTYQNEAADYANALAQIMGTR